MEYEILYRLSHLSLMMLSSWVGMPIRYLALNQAYSIKRNVLAECVMIVTSKI